MQYVFDFDKNIWSESYLDHLRWAVYEATRDEEMHEATIDSECVNLLVLFDEASPDDIVEGCCLDNALYSGLSFVWAVYEKPVNANSSEYQLFIARCNTHGSEQIYDDFKEFGDDGADWYCCNDGALLEYDGEEWTCPSCGCTTWSPTDDLCIRGEGVSAWLYYENEDGKEYNLVIDTGEVYINCEDDTVVNMKTGQVIPLDQWVEEED